MIFPVMRAKKRGMNMAIYYDPRVHDMAGAAIAGVMQGMQIAGAAKGVKAKLNTQKANAEVGQMENDFMKQASEGKALLSEKQSQLETLKVPEKPQTIIDPFAREYMGAEAYQKEQTALLDYNKSAEAIAKQREKLTAEIGEMQKKGLQMRGGLDQKIIETYNKYGLKDEAERHRLQHYDIAKTIGASVGPEAALHYLQNGPDRDLFDGATVAEDGKFKVVELKDGSVIRTNEKTGEYELIKSKNPSKITSKIEQILTGNDTKTSTLVQTDEEGNVSMKPVGPPTRFRKGGGGSDGDGGVEGRSARKEALTENKTFWDDIGKQMKAVTENLDASDNDKKKAQSVLSKLPAYRKLDSEAIRLGREPRNATNIQDFLNGAGGDKAAGANPGGNPAGVRDLNLKDGGASTGRTVNYQDGKPHKNPKDGKTYIWDGKSYYEDTGSAPAPPKERSLDERKADYRKQAEAGTSAAGVNIGEKVRRMMGGSPKEQLAALERDKKVMDPKVYARRKKELEAQLP